MLWSASSRRSNVCPKWKARWGYAHARPLDQKFTLFLFSAAIGGVLSKHQTIYHNGDGERGKHFPFVSRDSRPRPPKASAAASIRSTDVVILAAIGCDPFDAERLADGNIGSPFDSSAIIDYEVQQSGREPQVNHNLEKRSSAE